MNINYDSPFNFKPIPTITPTSDYWQNGTWKFNMSEITAGAASQPSWIDIILKGNTALTLVNAKANSLEYLKLFGDTEQLPSTYLDTVTLSGGCEQRNLPSGYTQVEYLGGTKNAYADLGTITIEPTDTIYCECILVNNGNRLFGLADHTRCYVAQSGTGTPSFAGKSYPIPLGTWIIDGTTVNTIELTSSKFTINGVAFTPTGTASSDICSSFGINTIINGTSGSDTSVSYIKKFYIKSGSGNYKVNLISSKNADNTFGYYDTVSKTLLTNQGEGAFSAGAEVTVPTPDYPMDIVCNNGAIRVDSQGNIYTDGTQEVVTDSLGNTANAERLLAVGDYKDMQEVLGGSVTRNIGIKVLDGSENWTYDSTYSRFLTYISGMGTSAVRTLPLLCNYYQCIDDGRSVADVPNYSIYAGSNAEMYIKTTQFTSSSDWKTYLSTQYANGTPVIIVYPLETATTETVEGQFLSKSPVTQTLGSIDNLPIAITELSQTVPTPQQPLPINCNNGVLGIDSQGNITVTGTTETVQITGKNLFDKNATNTNNGYIANGYLNLTGTFVSSSSYNVSEYIPVLPSTEYFWAISLNVTSHNAPRIAYYTSNKTYISSSDTIRDGVNFTTPNNCTYIRLPIYKTTINVAQLELGSTATTYEPYYNGGTATAENLFKVGAYQDVQNVITGEITRNCEVVYYDGTQTINTPYISTTGGLNIGSIIVHPKTTPTTETVTPQPLTIQAGTNIVQITQASMDELELEAKYQAGVSVTITEIENAQLDNNVEVTIQ